MTLSDTTLSQPLLAGPLRYPVGSDEPAGPTGFLPEPDRYLDPGRPPDPAQIIQRVRCAALTGYGGAHFPVHRKWESIRRQGRIGIVVGNGAESEPLSAKDVALLQWRPHLVLDGLELAARAVGANQTVLWLHDTARSTRRALEVATQERPPGRRPMIQLGPDGYLTGESSAVVRALSGGPALPTFRPVRGRLTDGHGTPVLVHNIETLARIALAVRGVRPSSRLFTVCRRGVRTVVEVAAAGPLTAALAVAEDGLRFDAVLVGGYGGRWCSAPEVGRMRADQASGAGVLLPVDPDECGLRVVAAIAEYLAEAGARQCGPCRFGLPEVADLLDQLVDAGRSPDALTSLRLALSHVSGRGACGHPDGMVSMVSSALDVFADDLDLHLTERRCRHGG